MQPTSINYWFVVSNLTFCCSAYLGMTRPSTTNHCLISPETGGWNPLCLLINQHHPQIEAPLPSLVTLSPHSVTSPTLPHFETRHFLPSSYPRKNVDQCWSYHQQSQELLTNTFFFSDCHVIPTSPLIKQRWHKWLLLHEVKRCGWKPPAIQTGGIVFIICPAGHPSEAVKMVGWENPTSSWVPTRLLGGKCNS